MGEGERDSKEIYRSSLLTTKEEKIQEAERLRQELIKAGLWRHHVKELVAHEKAHALADKKGGTFKITLEGRVFTPHYIAVGPRSKKEKRRIALAPNKPSPDDLQIAKENQSLAHAILIWLASLRLLGKK